jgi:hypothetical protein
MKKRLQDLAIKLISVKGLVFIMATVLLFFAKITVTIWFIFAGIFVGIRCVEKMIRAYSGIRGGE